ncbi:MAG: hypothetical protein ABUR63_01725, partial [Verrucomicrobiota bacterium]
AACSGGLVCLSQICVQPAAAGAGGAGGGGIRDGAAGGGPATACTAAMTMLAPVGGLIDDFTATDGGFALTYPPFPYPDSGPARPTATQTGGALHITESGPATSAAQYVGVALSFVDCIDATAFTGIQFSISGSFSGCTMQYASGDSEHQDLATGAPNATGPAGAYPPQSTLSAAQVTATPQILMMPFTGTTIFGNPQTPLDTAKLIFALWQFTIPAAAPATADGGTPVCVADITIDNLKFY